jgi:internalin A
MLKKTFLLGMIFFLIFISFNVFAEVTNMENIINGDFSNGTSDWNGGFYTPGEGSISESNGELLISITNGGTETWNIQINQGNINLVSGTEYTLSFDARSVAERTMEANVGMSVDPYESYFASGALDLSIEMTTYSFTFTADADDSTARLEFNCGLDDNDIYIDNVSLIGGSESEPVPTPTPEIINFNDLNLEEAIRTELGITDDPIYNTDVYSITSENLSKLKITDITGLEHFSGLTNLILGNNKVTDITPIENLNNLKTLNIGANHLVNIEPLENLSNLSSLNLVVNDINDISSLANLTNMTELLLEYNDISDITPLENLNKLSYLKLNDNEINSITPFENLTDLTYLDLSNNEISDIAPLSNCTKITNLNLCGNPITDITALGNLTNLKTLVLNVGGLENIEPLANCTNLVSLNLNLNSISDITPLENLTNLSVVFLVGNPLNEEAQTVINKLLENGTRVVWTSSSTETPTETPTETQTETPTPTETPSTEIPNDKVEYTIVNDWGEAATINVTISNTENLPINGWTLSWTFSDNQEIINLWGGSFTQSEQDVIVKNDTYNETIPVNGSVSFGFNLNYSGSNSIPDSFTLK